MDGFGNPKKRKLDKSGDSSDLDPSGNQLESQNTEMTPTRDDDNAFRPYAKKPKLDKSGDSSDLDPRPPRTPLKGWGERRRDDEENSSHATHPVLLDLGIARRLFKRSVTKEPFDKLKDDLQSSLQDRLKQLLKSEQMCEDVLEVADSAYAWMLLNSSNHNAKAVDEEARKAIMLLQDGVRRISEGQRLLKSAFPNLFSAID